MLGAAVWVTCIFVLSSQQSHSQHLPSATPAHGHGELTISLEPTSGWINYTTNANLTFHFSPPCKNITLFRGRRVFVYTSTVPQSNVGMWNLSIVDLGGAWIRFEGVTALANGYFQALCVPNNMPYTTSTSHNEDNVQIGINPRILSILVHQTVSNNGDGIYNLTRTNAAEVGDETDIFWHEAINLTSSHIHLMFRVGKGLNRGSSNTSSLKFTVPDFDIPTGKYYAFVKKQVATTKFGTVVLYTLSTKDLASYQFCSIEGLAIALLPGAQAVDIVKFGFNVTYSQQTAKITVSRSNSLSCSCVFSCNLFSCPSISRTNFTYKWAIFNKNLLSSKSFSTFQLIVGNVPNNQEQYQLNPAQCQTHFKNALENPETYKIVCEAYLPANIELPIFESSVPLYSLLRPCDEKTEFQCPSDLQCVSLAKKCNGHVDCNDGSDEENCYPVAHVPCPLGEFQCSTPVTCIPYHKRCDFFNDCNDGSDEANCLLGKTPCPIGFFMCSNRKCRPSQVVCNGKNDCGDFSDESRCNTSGSRICGDIYFQCPGNKGDCVRNSEICNGENDCGDDSDEINCGKYYSTDCGPGRWRCGNGRCIRGDQLCDESPDCEDDSDEKVCGDQNDTTTIFLASSMEVSEASCLASDGKFMCANGKCLSNAVLFLCNGFDSCGDMSDESEAVCSPCPSTILRFNRIFSCDKTKCISPSQVCDGRTNCRDNSDETICDDCSLDNDLFKCDEKCIHFSRLCTGEAYCNDRSDESPEACKLAHLYKVNRRACPKGTVKCSSTSVCVPEASLCDGIVDCCLSDGSRPVTENSTHVGECEKTDELGCRRGVSCAVENGGCSKDARCISLTMPPEPSVCGGMTLANDYAYCACNTGFTRSFDKSNQGHCEDIDECKLAPFSNHCTQRCHNTMGSYSCSCRDGFIDTSLYSSNNSTFIDACVVADKELSDAFGVLFIYHDTIRFWQRANFATVILQTALNGTFTAMDVDIRDGTIILAESNNPRLLRTSLPIEGHQPPVLALHYDYLYNNVKDLALDFVGNNLYVVDLLGSSVLTQSSRIVVSLVDGRYQKELLITDMSITAVAVNPFRGRLYYARFNFQGTTFQKTGFSPLIMTSMNGEKTHDTVIYQSSKAIQTITVDYLADGNLYFAEGRSLILARYDGSFNNTFTIRHAAAGNRGFDVFNDMLYGFLAMSEYSMTADFYELDKFSRDVVRMHRLTEDVTQFAGVRTYHPLKAGVSSNWPNPCRRLKCSHLCLLDWNAQPTCACPDSDGGNAVNGLCSAETTVEPEHPATCFRHCNREGGICVTSDNSVACSCFSLFTGPYCNETSKLSATSSTSPSHTNHTTPETVTTSNLTYSFNTSVTRSRNITKHNDSKHNDSSALRTQTNTESVVVFSSVAPLADNNNGSNTEPFRLEFMYLLAIIALASIIFILFVAIFVYWMTERVLAQRRTQIQR